MDKIVSSINTILDAVSNSKTDKQKETAVVYRAIFLATEFGEVQKEFLKLAGLYGLSAAATAKPLLAKELCDLIWNICDLANMLDLDLGQAMTELLHNNKTRTWEK